MSVTVPATQPPTYASSDEVLILRSGEQPAAGETVKRIRNASGWTQDEFAIRMGVTRSAVATWELGTRWPEDVNLDKLILLLAPPALGVDQRSDGRVTQAELTSLLGALAAASTEEIDLADSMVTYAYPRVLTTLILRATGCPGINADTKSIALFLDHKDKVREEKQRRSLGKQRNVTHAQAKASAGDVYESPLLVAQDDVVSCENEKKDSD